MKATRFANRAWAFVLAVLMTLTLIAPQALAANTVDPVEPASGKILVTLPSSSPVAVVGKTDNWYQILFNDQLAYMSADYLRAVNE